MKPSVAPFLLLLFSVAPAQHAPVPPSTLKTAEGTTLPVIVVRQVQQKGLGPNDRVLLRTVASVLRNGHVLVPVGTELQGEVVSVTKPGFWRPRVMLTVHFPEAILSSSYIVPLDGELTGRREDVKLTILTTRYDRVLLDTGMVFDLPLRTPLTIDVARVAAIPPNTAQMPSGAACTPTPGVPGSPGTPPTVVPGTPATPDTVIPGVNGAPPTVIPGTPAGPTTVIPGMPATPGTPGGCASSPQILSVALVP